jgi:hypothetical protein
MLLRCTAKLLALLRVRELATAPAGPEDWYANCSGSTAASACWWSMPTPCSRSSPPTCVPRSCVRSDPGWRPRSPGSYHPTRSVRLDPNQVRVAKTASRHVLGVMNDMASYAEAVIDSAGGLAVCGLERLNDKLRDGLHRRDGQHVTPLDLVAERLN